MITGKQIKAARALAGWTQDQLAEAASIAAITVKNLERGLNDPRSSTLDRIEKALKNQGIVFADGGAIKKRKGQRQ